MPRALFSSPPGPEFATRERCYITELLNDERVPGASLARCRLEPGVTTELHRLDVDECYVIEAGNGLMRVGDERFAVAPGDRVAIPAGIAQCIRNEGDDDLVFLCLCLPRFDAAGYEPLEAN